MNQQSRKFKPRSSWTAEQDAAVTRLANAAQQNQAVDTQNGREQIRSAVDAARDAGVGWTKIGDTLGIASGNAYQRYRKRPEGTSGAGQPCEADGAHC